MIAGVLSLFLYGWSSCTSRQMTVSKMKTTRLFTTIAKSSIRTSLDHAAYPTTNQESSGTSSQLPDWPEIADRAVDNFFNDEGKNPRGFPNPYNRKIPVFTRQPASTEPGVVYIDVSQASEGKVIITGVYIDPNSQKTEQWVETLKIPGERRKTIQAENSTLIDPTRPEYYQTPAALPPNADGQDCDRAILIESLDDEIQWLNINIPGSTLQKRTISQCSKDLVDILIVRTPDGSKRTVYFKLNK